MRVQVSVTSDFVCPWCFVGERRLAAAIARLPDGIDVAVEWRPFELNPAMPPQGMDRRAYRVAKFGSWERGQAMDARLAAVAAQDGLQFNFDRITRTPNTLPAHRLMWLAATEGLDTGRLASRLLEAYFTEGRDVSDPAVLADIGGEVGFDPARVTGFLAGDEGASAVHALLSQARAEDIDGVPFFRIGDAALFGAQPVEVFAAALRQAASGQVDAA
jgi:predicted DsbA family dithiol-disulfide isomerase